MCTWWESTLWYTLWFLTSICFVSCHLPLFSWLPYNAVWSSQEVARSVIGPVIDLETRNQNHQSNIIPDQLLSACRFPWWLPPAGASEMGVFLPPYRFLPCFHGKVKGSGSFRTSPVFLMLYNFFLNKQEPVFIIISSVYKLP